MRLAGLGASQVPTSVRHPGYSVHSSWVFTPNSTWSWGNELTQRASPEVFLKIFLMWTSFKVYIQYIILLLFYVLVFWPLGMWDLASLTEDWTCSQGIRTGSPICWHLALPLHSLSAGGRTTALRSPPPNPQNPWIWCLTWQKGHCRCDEGFWDGEIIQVDPMSS